MRILGLLRLLPLVTIAVALVVPVHAETAHTTRIETRPVYGATVTIEHGVRVYRPIPPTEHLIVNPDRAPLLLSVESPAATWPR
jgi:hypothetical protein